MTVYGWDTTAGTLTVALSPTADGLRYHNGHYALSGNDFAINTSEGLVKYCSSGGGGAWDRPRPSGYGQYEAGGWHFRNYNATVVSMPDGHADGGAAIGDTLKLQIMVIVASGDSGTLTVWGDSTGAASYELYGVTMPNGSNSATDTQTLLSTTSATFPSTDIAVPAGYELYSLIVRDLSANAGSWFFGGWEWTAYAAPLPQADFAGTPVTGTPGVSVAFTDLTLGTPTSWSWDFGDGGTSTSQNPTHVYAAAGRYTVALTATNMAGTDTETKVEYVIVTDPGVVIDPTGTTPIAIGPDVISWHVQRGASPEITGSASVGTATVVLKNSIAAGADADDKYNPENGSSPVFAYLRDGAAIHISVNADGRLAGDDPVGVFGGRTQDWTVIPAPGAGVAPTVEVTCEDALGWYARTPVNVPYFVGRSQKVFRQAILADADETRTDLDNEIITLPLSSADGNALAALEAINRANGTRHFIRPAASSSDWYTYVTRNRQYGLTGTSDYALNQQDDHVTGMQGWRLSADTVINQQRATVTPVTFTPSTLVVWHPEAMPLNVTVDRPYEVWVEFDDYVKDPTVNSAYSGATPTITLTSFGTSAKLTITVASGTCTFTSLDIQGALARRAPNQSWVADDLTSQAPPRGVRAGSEISGEYVGTLAAARGIAEHVVWRYATPQTRPTLTVENWLPEQYEVEIGDIIAYTSPQLGVSGVLFEVVGITHDGKVAAGTEMAPVVHHVSQFVLERCRVQADPGWFVLDTSELDSTDILAY